MRILSRLKERLGASASRIGAALSHVSGRPALDPAAIADLEDALIATDLGVELSARLAKGVARRLRGNAPDEASLRKALAGEIASVLAPVAVPFPERDNRPGVMLFVGVNGSGKTTTIGKLASRYRKEGKHVMVAACDTFRAAAVEQLEVWCERAGAMVVKARTGGDAAGLAFDAHAQAVSEGVDILLVDTAGRLQNKRALMEELAKIRRVLAKRDEDAPHDVILVLDASIGQNTHSQVDIFGREAGVTGLIMTKLDGSARGGVLVAVAERTGLPVHAIGIGEAIGDLVPLHPQSFANAITGCSETGKLAA